MRNSYDGDSMQIVNTYENICKALQVWCVVNFVVWTATTFSIPISILTSNLSKRQKTPFTR